LHAAAQMASIIRQTPPPNAPALPDLRNLGTVLRVLLAVNGGAALIALAMAGTPAQFVDQWVRITGFVEPHLIVALAVLYAAGPALARQPYRIGVALVFALVVVTGLAAHLLTRGAIPEVRESLFKHLLFALASTAILLAYFHLRARALSPRRTRTCSTAASSGRRRTAERAALQTWQRCIGRGIASSSRSPFP
jgi:two-component system sensor histidine kinase AlgZ